RSQSIIKKEKTQKNNITEISFSPNNPYKSDMDIAIQDENKSTTLNKVHEEALSTSKVLVNNMELDILVDTTTSNSTADTRTSDLRNNEEEPNSNPMDEDVISFTTSSVFYTKSTHSRCRFHTNLRGILVNNSAFKIAAYADNLTIGVGSPLDWLTLFNILAKYEKASNAIINKSKSTLILLTDNARRIELPNQPGFKLLNESQNTFTVLGYEIDTNGQSDKTLWANMTKKIKNKI
ncbi:4686_t:CDS:2, partial [Ambispora leptoticha]